MLMNYGNDLNYQAIVLKKNLRLQKKDSKYHLNVLSLHIKFIDTIKWMGNLDKLVPSWCCWY